jgi:hypothetical protein
VACTDDGMHRSGSAAAVAASAVPNGTSPRSVGMGMASFSPTQAVAPLALAKGKLSFDFGSPASAPANAPRMSSSAAVRLGTSTRSRMVEGEYTARLMVIARRRMGGASHTQTMAASTTAPKKTTGFTPFAGAGNTLK